jgi:hypothetical protein
MLKEIKMTSNTKQMIALMEALNAVNGADKASQSLNESTQVEERRRGADGKMRGRLFSLDSELQQKADRLYDSLYSLLISGDQVKQTFKKAGIDLDQIATRMMDIPSGGLESSYTGDADGAEEQNEAFGMPGKRNDRQTDTMYNLAMDYKQKFDFETFPVGEHMKEWFADVAGEMKDAGITPMQMRVFLTAAYTFAKGGFFTPKSESAELSEDTIEKILKKMADDGKLTVDKKGNYTSTLEPVSDPETKKATATSIGKNAKPGPRRDRAVANLSSSYDPEIQTEMAGDDKAAIVRDLYKGFQGDVNDKDEIKAYLRGPVTDVAREEGISAMLLKMAVNAAINGFGPEELYEAFDLERSLAKTDMVKVNLPNGRSDHLNKDKAAELVKAGKLKMTGQKTAVYVGEMNEAFGLSGKKPTTPEETKAYILKKYAGEIKKVRGLYKQYQGAEGPNMSRDGKLSRFKDATKSTDEWLAYRDAGQKLQQKIWQQIRKKDLPGAGELVASFPDFQKILQK